MIWEILSSTAVHLIQYNHPRVNLAVAAVFFTALWTSEAQLFIFLRDIKSQTGTCYYVDGQVLKSVNNCCELKALL